VPAFTDKIQLSGWARCQGSAVAQILAVWMDDMQKVLRVDAGPESRSEGWQELTLAAGSQPEHAHTVRLAALARGGEGVGSMSFICCTCVPRSRLCARWSIRWL